MGLRDPKVTQIYQNCVFHEKDNKLFHLTFIYVILGLSCLCFFFFKEIFGLSRIKFLCQMFIKAPHFVYNSCIKNIFLNSFDNVSKKKFFYLQRESKPVFCDIRVVITEIFVL